MLLVPAALNTRVIQSICDVNAMQAVHVKCIRSLGYSGKSAERREIAIIARCVLPSTPVAVRVLRCAACTELNYRHVGLMDSLFHRSFVGSNMQALSSSQNTLVLLESLLC